MFLDEAEITVHGGNGGNGLVSWRKEKFISRGGPWGGDGGDGGNVIFRADSNTDTLSTFAQVKVFRAKNGGIGGKCDKHGKNGEDLVLKVPPGTVIYHDGSAVADLTNHGDEEIIAKGGRGGYGNAHFTSSVRQAPDFAERGEAGEEKSLNLELKLVADVGIIGYPSVGKSTLISVISASRPKIGDYPFTTITPNLGVVQVHDRRFVACDVPGLIDGASEGKGLGDTFLRHIERCAVLVHILDVNREDVVSDYKAIRSELENYSPALSEKKEVVVLNKVDLTGNDIEIFEEELKKNKIELFASISAATKHGIDDFLNKLLHIVLEERKNRSEDITEKEIPVLKPHLESDRTDAFTIDVEKDNSFTVKGKRIEQITNMTDWNNESAIHRFRDIIKRIGLTRSLEKAGAGEKSVVRIGELDVSDHWL
ncbi:GTPase ObgE [Candidatus Peribacteria bacterium]|jgi:GTPase|nr:GTPase ObgE [Candidatus Peribacteria bacterium]MBT4473996.1 GTPase ObgE [Candidatus Peribacteria bacterium]